MSEEKKETQKAHVPFTIEIDPVDFDQDFSGKFATSKDFCNLTNTIFRAVFADYVGSQFELVNGQPTMSLYFDHAKVTDGEYACERITDQTVGNVMMDKIHNRDSQLKDGDRYHLTQNGKDAITGLLLPRFYNQGKINWKQVASDVTERTAVSYYQPQNVQQMTKVVGIDPVAICKLIWGKEEVDADGNKSYIDYGVNVMTNLTAGMVNMYPNYLLQVTKAFTGTITKTYEKLGVGGVGSPIIK